MATALATIQYGTPATVVITLAELPTNAALQLGRQGVAVSNRDTGDGISVLVGGKVTTGPAPTAARQIEVWLAGSWDGVNWSGGVSGSDNTSTPSPKEELKLLTIIPTTSTASLAYYWGPHNVRKAFGGDMPLNWTPWITHNTGTSLASAAASHFITYTVINYDSA